MSRPTMEASGVTPLPNRASPCHDMHRRTAPDAAEPRKAKGLSLTCLAMSGLDSHRHASPRHGSVRVVPLTCLAVRYLARPSLDWPCGTLPRKFGSRRAALDQPSPASPGVA